MQKEKKNLKYNKKKNLTKRFQKKFFRFILKKKVYSRKKKYNSRLVFFFERYEFYFKQKASLFNSLLILRIKQNNLFVTLLNLRTNRVWKIWSCGLYKLNASKRQLKFIVNILLIKIFKYLKKKFRKANFVIIIRGMSFIKKKIIRKIQFFFRNQMYLLVSKSTKVFNGCRAKKIRRKKYKKFRVLK
jgi:hypothetical protein